MSELCTPKTMEWYQHIVAYAFQHRFRHQKLLDLPADTANTSDD